MTHHHPDHVGGVNTLKAATERRAWGPADENIPGRDRALSDGDRLHLFGLELEVIAVPGHTLGHMMFMVESTGEHLLLAADFACHHVWSLAYPDWEMRLDEDKEQAAKTRRAVLEMLASDKIPFIGYHMPWPSVGYVDRLKDGRFHYVPESYQLLG